MNHTILIAGAGIAGPALAHWLTQHGMTPTVVERAPQLRQGGQTVDLRGAGLEVARRMGVESAARAAATEEEGVRFVDSNDRTKAALSVHSFDGQGPVSELEILRAELGALLYHHTRNDTEYIFGDSITALDDDGEQVQVTFGHGAGRSFDLVVAADGLRSHTRDLVFGDAARIKPLGLCTAYFTIPRQPADGGWARWHSAPGGRSVLLRPDNLGTTRVGLSFASRVGGYERLDPEEQKALLRRLFADLGWETPRILAEMENTPDFFFDASAQVHMPRWSRGRVAVVGDAGYCPSPISGTGTSLSLVGAYVLAGELARHNDPRDAFTAYETTLRQYVERAQHLPPGVPRLTMPRSKTGIRTFNTILRTATRPRVSKTLRRVLRHSADTFTLPTYNTQAPLPARSDDGPVPQ